MPSGIFTADQIAEYQQEGYFVAKSLFDGEELASCAVPPRKIGRSTHMLSTVATGKGDAFGWPYGTIQATASTVRSPQSPRCRFGRAASG